MSATSTRDRHRTEVFVNAPPHGSQAQGLRRALPFCKRKSELSAVRQGADQFGNDIAPSVILAKPGKPCPRFAAHARPRAHRLFGQKERQMCGGSLGPLTDSTPNPHAPAKARVRSRADWRKGSLDAWLRTGALLTPSDPARGRLSNSAACAASLWSRLCAPGAQPARLVNPLWRPSGARQKQRPPGLPLGGLLICSTKRNLSPGGPCSASASC